MIRQNRHNTSRNSLLNKLSGICFGDNDASGGGGSPASAQPASGGDPGGGAGEAGPSLGPSGGGQVQQDAGHSFGNSPAPAQGSVDRVTNLLSSHPETVLSMDDIAALINFNPPFNSKTQTPPRQTTVPVAAQPNAAVTTPTPQQSQPAPSGPSTDAQAIIAAIQAQQTAAIQQPQSQSPQPQQPVPYYGGEVQAMQVSPQILQGILGTDDPAVLSQAAPAVNALVNGIMNRVIADMNTRMQSSLAAVVATHVPQQIQAAQQVNDLETKFYSTHKHLNQPALKPLVNQISGLYAQAMKKSNPNFQWDQKAFSDVAALVNRQFEKTYGFKIPGTGPVTTNVPAQTQVVQQGQPTQNQPYMSGGGTRPPVVSQPAHQSADVLAFVT